MEKELIEINARKKLQEYPFFNYINEDLSKYKPLSKCINPRTEEFWIDDDDDFLLGESGGVLCKRDFVFVDTWKFTKARDEYKKNVKNPPKDNYLFSGKNAGRYYYCPFSPDTKIYKDFWEEEENRRRYGFTAKCKLYKKDIAAYNKAKGFDKQKFLHNIRITGDHYHHLNYSKMARFRTDSEIQEELAKGRQLKHLRNKIRDFPDFWDEDYWIYKSCELAEYNQYFIVIGKARRKGHSYKEGTSKTNQMNLNRNYKGFIIAEGNVFLTGKDGTSGVMSFIKSNVEFIEESTGFRRGILSGKDISTIKLGINVTEEGGRIAEKGYLSSTSGLTCYNNPNCAVGIGANAISVEEAGVCSNLRTLFQVTRQTLSEGGSVAGLFKLYGTGGTKEANWEAFKDLFYKPLSYDCLPFENVWDRNKRATVCGYFHPNVLNYNNSCMDSDGNSIVDKAFIDDYVAKQRAKQNKSTEEYIIEMGQAANSPEEAFNQVNDNIFTSPELVQHAMAIEHNPDIEFEDVLLVRNNKGIVLKKSLENLKIEDKVKYDKYNFIEDFKLKKDSSPYGAWRIMDEPYRDATGVIPDNLYYAVCDPIGKEDAVGSLDSLSLYCITIWMYPNIVHESGGDVMVAAFKGRDSFEALDEEAFKGCDYYNAKLLYESNRGEVKTSARNKNKLNLLLKDPTIQYAAKLNLNVKNIPTGINMSGDKKKMGLAYLRDFLYTPYVDSEGNTTYNFHKCKWSCFLKELLAYDPDGNFDMISTAIMMPYQRMAYISKKLKPVIANDENKTSLYEALTKSYDEVTYSNDKLFKKYLNI